MTLFVGMSPRNPGDNFFTNFRSVLSGLLRRSTHFYALLPEEKCVRANFAVTLSPPPTFFFVCVYYRTFWIKITRTTRKNIPPKEETQTCSRSALICTPLSFLLLTALCLKCLCWDDPRLQPWSFSSFSLHSCTQLQPIRKGILFEIFGNCERLPKIAISALVPKHFSLKSLI